MAVVGAVEGLYCLARVVVAEEGADLPHSFLAVVAEVVGDLYNLEEEAMEVEL